MESYNQWKDRILDLKDAITFCIQLDIPEESGEKLSVMIEKIILQALRLHKKYIEIRQNLRLDIGTTSLIWRLLYWEDLSKLDDLYIEAVDFLRIVFQTIDLTNQPMDVKKGSKSTLAKQKCSEVEQLLINTNSPQLFRN